MNDLGKYAIRTFPASRVATVDIGVASHLKHHVKALIELDVTDARRYLAQRKKTDPDISFNAWLIKCISWAVAECPDLHAIRKGKRKTVIFEDVDISIMIEREFRGEKVPLPYVLRNTNAKSIAELSAEIRAGRQQPLTDEGDFVLGEKKNQYMMKLYYLLPGIMRRYIWRRIICSPFITKRSMGTVLVTSVGMMGKIRGWVIPVGVHPLSFAVGSIVKKPGVSNDKIEIRDFLYVTVAVDHDVIDGAPAFRALARLARMIETGYGLLD